ncbi:MAG: tyrosine-type recombinase/integrase [Porticoccus sp.]
MRVKLTQPYINNPPPLPAGKAKIEHCDTAMPGLLWEQRVTSPDWGSFRLRYKANGKTTYVTVGRSCDISLAEAKKKARQLKAEIELGADPQAEARAKKAIITWSHYMESTYMPHVKAHIRSWKNLESLNEKYLEPEIGHLALDRISLQKAQTLHRDMIDVHGLSPASADHLAKLLRQALLYAVRLDLLASTPVSKIQLFNVDNRRENLLSDDELQRLLVALDKANDRRKTAALVIKFLISTGARVSEALNAQWTDIDRERQTWTIQATNSKSKRRRSVPLSDVALDVLNQLETEAKSKYLFTNSKTKARLTTINKVWIALKQEADLPQQVRLYDATRHQHASLLINSGQSLYVVQQILGHSDPSVTQRYAHLSTETLQAAANSVGDYLDKALDKKK